MARLLTFLATDLVESTRMLSDLGESRAASLHHAYLEVVRRAIAASGGREATSFGDGVTAAFDGPSEAVGCAVAMQRAFHRHNGAAAERLDVRIGIAVGEVAGGPEELERDGVPGGPAVRARRLCDASLGGQILVSNLVAVLAGPRSRHGITPVGLLQLQGFAEPMAAFEVEYERPAVQRPAAPREIAA